jgi:hypothetical protein
MSTNGRRVKVFSAALYVGLSLMTAGGFFATASLRGTYPDVARFGGALWVFLLSMIVSMPLVIPAVKKRLQE